MKQVDRAFVHAVLSGILLAAQAAAQEPQRGTPPASPKLADFLSRDHAPGSDTESFWREIAEVGTPLVEPTGHDAQHTLVTFLWRHTLETRNVLVVGSFSILPSSDHLMERIPGSDIWYLSIRLPASARFAYKLSVNDPLVFDGSETARRDAAKRADPLNPHRWFHKPGASAFEYASRVELPGAPAQPWIVKHSAKPAGEVRHRRYKSKALGNERDIWVYTPPGYDRQQKAAVLLLVFDGRAYLDSLLSKLAGRSRDGC